MAYYSGTANDLSAIRQALIDACTLPAEGWAWDSVSEVLSKGTMFARITVAALSISLLGRTSLSAGDAPSAVRIGRLLQETGYPTYDITFPASYEIFLFDQEVFMVINYDVDCYQWLGFGTSTLNGLPGTGMWIGASAATVIVGTVGSIKSGPIYITDLETGGGDVGNQGSNSAALFWAYGVSSNGTARNCWVHSDLDGHGWNFANATDSSMPIGNGPLFTLIRILPNAWNSEAVLLPIRAYKIRPSNRLSLTADLENARHTRIDNYVPGQIITIGSTRWKIFPWFRKNIGVRNGGINLDHTGTFGWAIRYEGP